MNMFTAEDIDKLADRFPYGLVDDPLGNGKSYWYQNPVWEPTQIGNFQDYFRAEYHDWVIDAVRHAVETEGMDINRHSSKVPGYDQVFLEDPEIRSVKSSEVMQLPWETFGDDGCNTTIQVDAVVTSGVTLYESTSQVSDHSSQWFRVRTYLDLLSGNISRPVVSVYQRENNPCCRSLTDELCPVIPKDQMDSEVSRILTRYLPEGLNDPAKLQGELLARRLGLKICYADLGSSGHHYGRLYFEAQDVTVFDADGKLEVITVKPRTILLDIRLQGRSRTVTRKREDTIAHECLHYIEHACFFYFQQLHHESIAFLASDGPVKVYHGGTTPIDRVERQTSQLAARLRMPWECTKQKILECLKKYQHLNQMEAINRTIHDLSLTFNVSYETAKYRMVELGYPEARGVMNFIDGRYVDDYTAEDDGRRYAVTLEQLEREYQRNPKLRQLAETDEYVYVGGYLVRFSPESVRLENGKYRLTSTAQMDISRYCIGFTPCRIGKHYDYDPDSFHLDHSTHPDDLRMDEHQDIDALMKLDRVYHQTVSEKATGFAENLTGLMKQFKITVPVLVEDTGISERTIKNYRNGKSAPTLEYIISICVAMGLSSWTSRNLLKSAHFTFDASEGQPYEAYSFIIDYMTVDYSVREVNEYLRKKGIPPLSMPNTR